MWRLARATALALLATTVACSGGGGKAATPPATMRLTSTAFVNGGTIPKQYTCDGANQSPPLAWSAAPKAALSVALIMEDLDSPFLHWLVYDIPATQTSVETGVTFAPDAVNDFGRQSYGGPCPPAGRAHHYRFTVLALPSRAQVSGRVSGKDLKNNLLRSAPLGIGELTATHQRS